jgi:hypothetical protein
MESKMGIAVFNDSAKIITALFALWAAVIAYLFIFVSPLSVVVSASQPVAGSIGIFVEAAVGFNAARLFGGRKSFTGRLISYYSVALLLQAVSWLMWGLLANGQIPTGGTLIFQGFASLAGQALAAFALARSVQAMIIKVDRRIVALILVSLLFSAALAVVVGVNMPTLETLLVFGGFWPVSVFVQLASGLILVSLLGRWYLARPLGNIAFAYIGYSIATALATMLSFTLVYSQADFWVIISILSAVSSFYVGLEMTQVRPKTPTVRTMQPYGPPPAS